MVSDPIARVAKSILRQLAVAEAVASGRH
jgi:hypothetical protein